MLQHTYIIVILLSYYVYILTCYLYKTYDMIPPTVSCASNYSKQKLLLQDMDAVLALLQVADGVSRVHASRRFFEYLARHDIDIPVIHHRSFEPGAWPILLQLMIKVRGNSTLG